MDDFTINDNNPNNFLPNSDTKEEAIPNLRAILKYLQQSDAEEIHALKEYTDSETNPITNETIILSVKGIPPQTLKVVRQGLNDKIHFAGGTWKVKLIAYEESQNTIQIATKTERDPSELKDCIGELLSDNLL